MMRTRHHWYNAHINRPDADDLKIFHPENRHL